MHRLALTLLSNYGKNSSTAIIMHVIKHAGKAFEYLMDSRPEGFGPPVQVSNAPLFVYKGDEYPGTIEKRPKSHFFIPHTAIITGIGWDQINVFPICDIYPEQFRIFNDKFQPNGLLIYNVTDEECVKLVKQKKRKDIR